MELNRCQLYGFEGMAEPLGFTSRIWQRRNRLRRILKRRKNYIVNMLSEIVAPGKAATNASVQGNAAVLHPGDLVRVRSREEILSTVNRWNQLKGCAFMEEMWPFCGSTQRVLKRVEKFLDERDYLMKKCRGIVILEGVFCEGTKDFGACDRTCFFFWREEWLEKVEGAEKAQ
ncbi:MAG: hypothetical protein GXP63_06655 [DPANN group archaeon]|nr:hypothetical protein [DPANN group archaeon]